MDFLGGTMHSRKVLLWVILFHVVASYRTLAQEGQDYSDPVLDAIEESAVYDVLSAINPEVDWKALYPDNLCNGGPHGLVCDIDKEKGQWHVVELNLGWVSDYSNNPPCGINASFSPSIARFSRLRKLFLYRCFTDEAHKVTLPSYLWSLGTQLEELVFQDNPSLHGALDSNVGRLVGLKRLIITETGIGGAIPTEIRHLEGIEQLVLSGNSLNGSIPNSVGELHNLVILDLSRNHLGGPIPAELGDLKKLSKMDLSFNNMSGAVPESLGRLGSLLMMDLSYNNISGGIPSFLHELSSLTDLHLSGNPLGGVLPDFWDKLIQLKTLGLSAADLGGGIPDSMSSLKNLTYLALDNNNLSGAIPRELGTLSGIYNMDLRRNRLRGLVPFSSDFIERLGSKLQLVGNSGLCYDSDFLGLHSVRLNLSSCDEETDSSESSELDKYDPMFNSGSMSAGRMLFLVLSLSVVCVATL